MKGEPEFLFSTDRYQVIKVWPHDPKAFTEGLAYHDGSLYESTGGDKKTPGIGLSSIRRISLSNSRYSKKVPISDDYFAEGLAIFGERIFQLTYKTQVAFVYKLDNLEKVVEFSYYGEGWGLTRDKKHLIMSDGTCSLRFLHPETFTVDHIVIVKERNNHVEGLNELEYAQGKIYANILYENRVVGIDPESGAVTDSIDLTKLCRPFANAGILNGIAYDEVQDRWFVTGKNWPKLFEIRLKR